MMSSKRQRLKKVEDRLRDARPGWVKEIHITWDDAPARVTWRRLRPGETEDPGKLTIVWGDEDGNELPPTGTTAKN